MASGTTGPPATTNSPAQPQPPKIDRLDISWIVIDRLVSEAAAFLEEILPNLKMFDLSKCNDAEQKRRWYNVREQYYPVFKDVRGDERQKSSERLLFNLLPEVPMPAGS